MKNIKKYMYIFSSAILVIVVGAFIYCQKEASNPKLTELEKQEEKIQSFLKSDYVKKHAVSAEQVASKATIFQLQEDPYYIFFYKDECPYCEDTFPSIEKYVESIMEGIPEMYFINMSMEEAQYLWSDSDTFNATPEVEDFEVVGTPTLLKIENGAGEAFIGQEEIEKELKGVSLK